MSADPQRPPCDPLSPVDLSLYHYHLPPEHIAQEPRGRREDSRLLVLERDRDSIKHCRFVEFERLLEAGDVLADHTPGASAGSVSGPTQIASLPAGPMARKSESRIQSSIGIASRSYRSMSRASSPQARIGNFNEAAFLVAGNGHKHRSPGRGVLARVPSRRRAARRARRPGAVRGKRRNTAPAVHQTFRFRPAAPTRQPPLPDGLRAATGGRCSPHRRAPLLDEAAGATGEVRGRAAGRYPAHRDRHLQAAAAGRDRKRRASRRAGGDLKGNG